MVFGPAWFDERWDDAMSISEALRTVRGMVGWDFSTIRDRMGEFGWSYPELLAHYVRGSSRALDVGTGGGEVFSTAARADDVALEYAGDRAAEACRRLPCSVVRGDHGRLFFPAGSFDLITDRHVGATPAEVLRVLEPGGIYLTQQPGGHICQNIFDALGWGSNEEFWRREQADDYWNVDRAASFYERAGCRVLRREEATVDYEFLDEGSLAFWLAHAPLPERLDPDVDRDRLDGLPLRTNWHADLLVVQK